MTSNKILRGEAAVIFQRHGTRWSSLSQVARGEGGAVGDGEGEGMDEGGSELGGAVSLPVYNISLLLEPRRHSSR